jgi:hypothetical protein
VSDLYAVLRAKAEDHAVPQVKAEDPFVQPEKAATLMHFHPDLQQALQG